MPWLSAATVTVSQHVVNPEIFMQIGSKEEKDQYAG
jgi:hypothetical protein